jgi:hypothetical protein
LHAELIEEVKVELFEHAGLGPLVKPPQQVAGELQPSSRTGRSRQGVEVRPM